ncbi:MAG: metal-dependent hydrolase [Acidimicrobiales bacterium]
MTTKPATRTSHGVRARRTAFDFGATPPHWLAGDAQSTHTVNVGNLLFPSGERFFCDSVRGALPYVTDPKLRDEIMGFIGQEGTHANQHDRCIEHMAGYGVDVRREMAAVERYRKRWNRRIMALPEPVRRYVVTDMVAVTAAAEHVTAYLGEFLVSGNNWDDIDVDPAMKHLFRWHGAEEIEHRHVAYDVFQHISGNYIRRVLPLGAVGVGLTFGWAALASALMRLDPTTTDRWSWSHHFRTSREGRMKSMASLLWDLRLYLRPSHHPSKLPGSIDAALAYLATAPDVELRRAG